MEDEGDKVISVHLKPRRFKFTPTTENTCPGNGREDGPWLHRLSDARVTKVKLLRDPTNEIVLEENWMHSTSTDDIGEKWTGETVFEYKNKNEDQNMEPTKAMMMCIALQVDHWSKEGLTWTRHHVESRSLLFKLLLSGEGPQLDRL